MRKVERREDASGLRDRLLRVCAREVERIERAARGPRGKVDAAHVRTLGQAIRELEAGTKQGGSTRAPTREGEQSGNGSRSAKSDASNGKPPAVGEATARMLERHRAAQ